MQKNKAPNIEHLVFINSPVEKVYTTLTTGRGWDSWFTRGTKVDLDEKFISLKWKNFGAGHYTTEDGGKIIKAEKDKEFIFQWSPSSHPTTVSIKLEKLKKGTLVHLKEFGYNKTKKDLKTLAGCAVGWGEALTLLKFYLEHGVTYGKVPNKL